MHSGLHVGGVPIYPASQVQTLCPFTDRHKLFGPHGDGWHASLGSALGGISAKVVT